MNYKQRLTSLLNRLPVDRPPFMPAIYDLKPVFINAPLHTFGQNKKEIISALRFEVEELELESLVVAYDIYNIEAEAVGCKIFRDISIGMPEVEAPLIQSLDEVEKLGTFSEIAGRMPLFVQATTEAQSIWGNEFPVRAGISGPFSMAAKIYPQGNLLMETMSNPEGIVRLLEYCTQVIKTYIKAYSKTEAGVVIFDSFVAPPMLSPELYYDLVLPFHKQLFQLLKENNILERTLIVGGNTSLLIPDFVQTEATQLLLDFSFPLEESKDILDQYENIVFRVNLPPALFVGTNTMELESYVLNVLNTLKDCKNLIIGTGILPPNVSLKNILIAKKLIVDFYN